VNLDTDPSETKKSAWKQAKRCVPFLSKGIRGTNQTLREHLQIVLARSVLVYHATQLVAAGLWTKDDITKMETTLYRKVYGVNNSVSNDILLNVLQNKDPIWDVLNRIASKIRSISTRNQDIREFFNVECRKKKD
jgi:hypothetical protein